MRATIRHTPPAVMQPCPADNTTPYIRRQIAEWQTTGVPVHTQSAMEIAAWFQTPRNGYAVFASTGTIPPAFALEIRRDATPDNREEIAALWALYAYVTAVDPLVTVTAIDPADGAICDSPNDAPVCTFDATHTVWRGSTAYSDSCPGCLPGAVTAALSDGR